MLIMFTSAFEVNAIVSPTSKCNQTELQTLGSIHPGNDTVPSVLDYNPTTMQLVVAGYFRDVTFIPEKAPGRRLHNFTFVSFYNYT